MERIFQSWSHSETSRVVGSTFDERECDIRLVDVKRWIAQHHTSGNDPYFYSAKKTYRLNPLNYKEQKIFLSLFAACIGIAQTIYWKTNPYFARKWAECQAFAGTKQYPVYYDERVFPYFERCGSVQHIWNVYNPVVSLGYRSRNAFCMTSPVWGLFIGRSCGGKPHHIIVERLKDARVCPPNFDIQKEVDPLTQEEISSEKLQSPQMIYLPNYVTDAKAFMLAILRAGKKEFSDPYCRREFLTKEREKIITQILDIFQISEEELHQCFQIGEAVVQRLDSTNPDRYEGDSRAFDEQGQYTKRAQHKLQDCFDDLKDPTLPEIDYFVDQWIDEAVRRRILEIYTDTFFVENFRLNNYQIDLMILIQEEELILSFRDIVEIKFLFELTPFLVLEYFKRTLSPEQKKEIKNESLQIKEDIKRSFRSVVLEVTGFYEELRKDDRAIIRIEYFEKMTGVSLREVSQEV